MKWCLLALICSLLSAAIVAQPAKDSASIAATRQLAAAPPPAATSQNTPPPALTIPAAWLQQPALLTKTLQPLLQSRAGERPSNISSPACQDTSYARLHGVTNGVIYIQSASPTADGGILVCGSFYDSLRPITHPSWKTFGLLVRLNEAGNILWQQQFEETTTAQTGNAGIRSAFELPGGDIICAGVFDTTSNYNREWTMIYRLNSSGGIIWKNCLKNRISTLNAPSEFHYMVIESATEGLSGDVILGGTTSSTLSSSSKFETVFRLNSLGQLVWDANYGNYGTDGSYRLGAEGTGVYMQGGDIIFVGLTHGNTSPQIAAAVTFLKIDYATGNLLSKRFYRPEYADNNTEFRKQFTYWYNKANRLANGHYLFSGKLFSDFMGDTPVKDHFGVVEVDASFNLVDAYTISSPLRTNYYNNLLRIDPQGGGILSVFHWLGSYEADVFFSAYRNKQFLKQRMKEYRSVGMPGNNDFVPMADDGYVYVQTYFEEGLLAKSYYEFRKMHNSDTSSACLGKDSALLSILPLNIIEDPAYYYFDGNRPNLIEQRTAPIIQAGTLGYSRRELCLQTNLCDTVKIHGNPVICGTDSYLDFTAFKRNTCGAAIQWQIDNYAVDSMKVLNDTTIRIWFKNINWQGQLYALLPAPACFSAVVDSVRITVIRQQTTMDLGPDRVLCTGNTFILHAGSTYNNYIWQDGSTDSLYTVTAPGLYWAAVSDVCGNSYRDSVVVTAMDVSFSLGPDRVRCNTDTIHLDGPAGYISYQWSPNYTITSTVTQHTVVSPAIDTFYVLKAEKAPGCFATDTVRVRVRTSPPVSLGADTSFCRGGNVLLNAGAGFTSYLWNTGAVTQQLTASDIGTYSVIATTADGCRSFDTLKVQQVYALPVISLDHRPLICEGGIRVLAPGVFSTYLWQDGSSSSSYTATGPGVYHVTVTDANQCKAADTVHITGYAAPPHDFLQDTAICNYGSIILKPLYSYNSYLWNTGAASSSLSITQPGRYWLTVTDADNCAGTDTLVVKLKDCLKGFYMPTGFTPNNDGKNDVLKPFIGGVVKEYRLVVYNRWGQPVFTSSDPQKGWNGTFNGILQETFVFVWHCTYRLEGEPAKTEKGVVTLIR